MARTVFHGQRGEVRHRYREGQEDQLGALGLVVNVLVLWNTLYLDGALVHPRRMGLPAKTSGGGAAAHGSEHRDPADRRELSL